MILGHRNIEGINAKVNHEAKRALDLTNTPLQSLNSIVQIIIYMENNIKIKCQAIGYENESKLREIKNRIYHWQNPELNSKE